jgi:hypothetical protein
MIENRKTIRNIDTDVLLEARIYALRTQRTLGDLITESLEFFMSEADDPQWNFDIEADQLAD